ncbi:MAG: chitobiase/beta-hexosaminidase C-terminal domain-containing protein [Treponema sp.]|nr:chitobiase/beta-hexosaminidase C-terminal domain-containing protein [Treponema sp.]
MKSIQISANGLLFFVCIPVFILAGCIEPTGYYGNPARPSTSEPTAMPLTAATPVANMGTGTYSSALSITLICATGGADIYYTTDGSEPVAGGTRTQYSSDVIITATTTLKAMAVKAGMYDSAVMTAAYTIKSP